MTELKLLDQDADPNDYIVAAETATEEPGLGGAMKWAIYGGVGFFLFFLVFAALPFLVLLPRFTLLVLREEPLLRLLGLERLHLFAQQSRALAQAFRVVAATTEADTPASADRNVSQQNISVKDSARDPAALQRSIHRRQRHRPPGNQKKQQQHHHSSSVVVFLNLGRHHRNF